MKLFLVVFIFSSIYCNAQKTKNVYYKYFLLTEKRSFLNVKCNISGVFWSGNKVEPHPMSLLYVDSLAMVINSWPKSKVELSVNCKVSKELDLKRGQYLVNLLQQTYGVKNSIFIISDKKNEGLMIKFNR